MPYIALARQWRPRTFQELLGQEWTTRALTNALTQQRLHHAYLFTGKHGTGKTSIARLFAKALSCEQGISCSPCLVCATCQSIDKGAFIDLLEIDGASKTRVEETRELLDNLQYPPLQGRFKIYLIDEVHMLSSHSFNALLKTLEEPPAHVKFLLATTDPHKIPATVLSRCVTFHLKPIPEALIQSHLDHILTQENHPAEAGATQLLAQAARGSLRDALSLLEQALACSSTALTPVLVRAILGYTQQAYDLPLLQAICHRDVAACFALSQQIAQEGGHYAYVLETLLRVFHQLAYGAFLSTLSPPLQPFATAFDAATLQLLYQITLNGYQSLPDHPSAAMGFEITLLRLVAFQPVAATALALPSHTALPLSTASSPHLLLHAGEELRPLKAPPPLEAPQAPAPRDSAPAQNAPPIGLYLSRSLRFLV